MAPGDSGHEAYTAIAWGVGLSHERSDIAGAEGFHSLEGNMCGTAMRGAVALPRHSSNEAGNKAKKAHCGGICAGGRSGVGGAKGGSQGEYAPAKHVPGKEPGKRVTGVGASTAACAVTHPRQEPYAGKPHVRFWAGGAG